MSQLTVTATGPDKLPSGAWSLGPLTIDWSLKSLTEIDVEISLFGLDIDNLTGTLSDGAAAISDTIDFLGVSGRVALEAKYAQGPAINGLYLEGRVQGPGFDTGPLNFRIVPW